MMDLERRDDHAPLRVGERLGLATLAGTALWCMWSLSVTFVGGAVTAVGGAGGIFTAATATYDPPNTPTVTAVMFLDTAGYANGSAFGGSLDDTIQYAIYEFDSLRGDFTTAPVLVDTQTAAAHPLRSDTVLNFTTPDTFKVRMKHVGHQGGASSYSVVDTFTASAVVWRANEPAGFTEVADRNWISATPTGWWPVTNSEAPLTFGSPPSAPTHGSASTVGIITASDPYDEGDVAAGEGISHNDSGADAIYVSIEFRLNALYIGQSSGTNKLMFTSKPSGAETFINFEGTGSGDLLLEIRNQGAGTPSDLPRNLGSVGDDVVDRDVWHTLEYCVQTNTGTNNDGEGHAWFNGTKVIEYDTVQWHGAGQTFSGNTRVSPVWGGSGTAVPANDLVWYISRTAISWGSAC